MQDGEITRMTISDGGVRRAVLEVTDDGKVVAVLDSDGLALPSMKIPEWVWREVRKRGLFYARDDALDHATAGGSGQRRSRIPLVALVAVAVVIAIIAISALVNGGSTPDSPSYNNRSTQGEPSQEVAESIASVYADAYAFAIAGGDSKEEAEEYAQFYTTGYHILGREHFGYSHDSALVFADRVDDKIASAVFLDYSIEDAWVLAATYAKALDLGYSEKRAEDIELAVNTLILEGYVSSLEQTKSIADAAVTAYGSTIERGESHIRAYIATQDAVKPLMSSGLPTQ